MNGAGKRKPRKAGSRPIPPCDPARLTELARGIVTRDVLVVNLDRREWRTSISLMADSLVEFADLGCILVPVQPHLPGRWINGDVPAVTIEAYPIGRGDLAELARQVDAMTEALYPEAGKDVPPKAGPTWGGETWG